MARDAFKWREPWRASIARQPRFDPVGREVLREFGVWLLVFAGMLAIGRWGQSTTPSQLLAIVSGSVAVAAALALGQHAIAWLSPRSFCSGPGGIVISRSEILMLVPWDCISGFEFREAVRPPELRLHLVDGSVHDLLLSPKADRAAIAAELQRRLGSDVSA